jgi:hypothetical protein
MIKKFIVLSLALLLISCEKKPQTPQDMILGNWSIADTATEPWKRDIRGFEFLPVGICNYKPGYWDWHKYENERLTALKNDRRADLDNIVMYYLGTRTKYSILKDSFKIFDLSEKKWEGYKIKKITNDSLILIKDTIVTTYVKKYYEIEKSEDFDAVILSSSGCYGTCTSNDIMIDKDGNIIYKGNYYVTKKGWHTAKISPSEFNIIMKRFKEADYMNLKNDYSAMITDNQNISVSFIKNGRIVKAIDDYAGSAPNEFIWAYIPLIKIGLKLDLESKKINKILDNDFFYVYLMTNDKKRSLELSPSEMFYLINLLMDVKDTEANFNEKYTFSYNNDFIKEIKTDGRYYKLYFKNGKTEIKDIGFNFVTENKLKEKFEIINR